MAVLLMMDGCSRCAKVKSHLIESGFPFKEINVLEKPEEAMKYSSLSYLIVPILYENGKSYTWEEVLQFRS
ncbi:glutaredoxin domain-containing protein [Bacillus sp. 2205SS5-2]|uniref:glutaredoxin domain-containing protein n=1 Tax=Bacillus sp. 2205SS5-2 TaxID=3109031 RepID=UPI003007E25A